MNSFKRYSSSTSFQIFLLAAFSNIAVLGLYLLLSSLGLGTGVSLALAAILGLGMAFVLRQVVMHKVFKPFSVIWQAVTHVSPDGNQTPAPSLKDLEQAGEMASALVQNIYALTNTDELAATKNPVQPGQTIVDYLPLPILALDKTGKIIFANPLAAEYLGRPLTELVGGSLATVVPFNYSSKDNLDSWINEVATSKVTAFTSWDRVKVKLPDDKGLKQFDLAAHYSKDNAAGYEVLLALFDHTDKYANEDNSTSYVALAVHELRTPLTMLRGYIEVFEDELGDKLTPELQGFMKKMNAAAQTLTAFVSNILNVARVDDNALVLSLHEANWNELLVNICKDVEMRVKVRGKTLQLNVQPNLPTVGVDKISIYEVVSNLIDNAVKYSGESTKIIVHARLAQDGSVETIVQDFGMGIPPSAINHLFTKFYRSHRSKGAVSGSGLGLYLVKAIVEAHGGSVWVQSKEGQGSSFGFTLVPYSKMPSNGADKGQIENAAHGWIKNHSMTRR